MIKHNDSHLDHGLSKEQVEYLFARFADRSAFFIETFELPDPLGDVPCALYGPTVGDDPITDDEAFMRTRGVREYASRMVHRPMRRTRTVTVIAGPHDGHACVLYTAFGGPPAPPEVFDPKLKDAARADSEKFWSEHALACEGH